MWCEVKANQVVKIISGAQNVTINQVQHPAPIFRSWTATELANIGVFPYSELPRDTKHHVYRGERFDIKSDEVVKVWDNITDRPLADVKAEYVSSTEETALNLLKDTDWYVLRKTETGEAVPDNVATYRANVRSAEQTIVSSVNSKKAMSTIKAMLVVPESGNAPMHDWPEPLE